MGEPANISAGLAHRVGWFANYCKMRNFSVTFDSLLLKPDFPQLGTLYPSPKFWLISEMNFSVGHRRCQSDGLGAKHDQQSHSVGTFKVMPARMALIALGLPVI